MEGRDERTVSLAYGLADGVFHHEKNDRVFLCLIDGRHVFSDSLCRHAHLGYPDPTENHWKKRDPVAGLFHHDCGSEKLPLFRVSSVRLCIAVLPDLGGGFSLFMAYGIGRYPFAASGGGGCGLCRQKASFKSIPVSVSAPALSHRMLAKQGEKISGDCTGIWG